MKDVEIPEWPYSDRRWPKNGSTMWLGHETRNCGKDNFYKCTRWNRTTLTWIWHLSIVNWIKQWWFDISILFWTWIGSRGGCPTSPTMCWRSCSILLHSRIEGILDNLAHVFFCCCCTGCCSRSLCSFQPKWSTTSLGVNCNQTLKLDGHECRLLVEQLWIKSLFTHMIVAPFHRWALFKRT